MLNTTFAKLHEAGACTEGYRKLAKHLGGVTTYGDDKPIPLSEIVKSNGLPDTLWTLRCTVEPAENLVIEFACRCAEHVLGNFEKLYPNDNRPRIAIDAARKCITRFSDAAYAAAHAAYAAAYAADAAAYAADAAAYAAHAADAVYAAYAAAYAADAAAYAADAAAYAAYAADAAAYAADAADAVYAAADAAYAVYAAADAAHAADAAADAAHAADAVYAAAYAAETVWQIAQLLELLNGGQG